MNGQTRVLVVDDNPDLLGTFSLILKRKGYDVETAEDGMVAVDKLQTHNFDVVLMDVIMPRMSGIEAFYKIKDINPEVKVIMMTAYSEEEKLKEVADNGVYCTLRKPIELSQLMSILNEATSQPVILVVDDDGDLCFTLTRALELKGYKVISAYSGEEAIKASRGTNCRIALVDYKMPLMDGLETYLKLREANSKLSAVMMTGYRDEMGKVVEEALGNSAIDYLYKPFAPEQALAIVNRLSKNHISGANNGQQKQYTAG